MNKKELTPQQIQQRKKLFIYPVFFIVFVICMYFIFVPFSPKETFEDVNGFNAEIPSAQVDEMPDKISAFEKTQDGEMKTLDDYAFLLTKEKETTEKKVVEDTLLNKQPESQIIASISAYQDVNREMKSFYQPTTVRENKEKEDLKRQIKELQEQIHKQATTETQYEMMEKSYKLASKYLNGQTTNVTPPLSAKTTNEKKKQDIIPVRGVSDGVVSRLGATTTNNNFYSLSDKKNLNQGIIKACVFSDQVLFFGENTGVQKILLRLLEAVQVGEIIIPRNTLLTGVAKLGNERLTVTVDNLIHDNKIINVSLKVYDMDGLEGINTPGSQELKSTKETVSTLTGNMETSINLNGSAGQQLATDLARGVIQNATSYFGKKLKTVKVTLAGNYMIYLTNSK